MTGTSPPSPLRRRALIAASGAALAAPASAQRANWPNQPVRFIGIFPPGGATDVLSRIWCQRMSEITGHQFVVENRTGSGGNVGTEAIARSTPDGYTIGLASVSSLSIAPTLYRRLPFDVTRDFSYICGLWQLPNLLVVHPSVEARTIQELIDLCKRNPGQYTFASSGSGTTVHLSGEMFKHLAGIDIVHVPYRGGAPANVDLLAGRVSMIFANVPEQLENHRQGRVRGLGVTGARRSEQLPDIPTMAEVLPGFEVTSWAGVCGPAGIPRPILDRIAEVGKEAVESDEVRRRFREQGASVWWQGPEQFAAFRQAQQERFAPLIRASGAQVD